MFSMFLDLRTLSFVLTLTTVALSILMLFIWRTSKTYSGFGFWAFANLSIAIGFLLLSLRGMAPDLITVIAANSLILGGILLFFTGNRLFLNLSDERIFSLTLLILNALAIGYFNYFQPHVVYRIICVSGILVIIGGRNCYDFGRGWRANKSSSYAFMSVVYLFFCLLMIARATLTYYFSDIEKLYTPDGVQSFSFVSFILVGIIWTFAYMILNNERLQEELSETKIKFEKLAATDFLTGINNNRRFFEIGELEIQRARRFHHPLSLIMFDIDYFKKINDTYGHAAGDKVLTAIIDVCKFNLRELDTIGRLGGEEFGIILPHTDIDVAKMVAGRLRRAFDENEIKISTDIIRATASFGVTEFLLTDKQLQDLLDRADSALYEAKQNGRNQVKASGNNLIPEPFPKISSTRIM